VHFFPEGFHPGMPFAARVSGFEHGIAAGQCSRTASAERWRSHQAAAIIFEVKTIGKRTRLQAVRRIIFATDFEPIR
jgi:ribose 5-phosphate isomerase RpiB